MTVAIDPNRALPFVRKADKKLPKPWTTFHIKPLCGSDARIALAGFGGETSKADAIIDIVQLTLTGWENFNTADGAPVAFETMEKLIRGKTRTIPTEATIARLDGVVLSELADAASDFSILSADDIKN